MSKGRISAEEHEARLNETARLLIRRRSYADVERELANKYDVDNRTARKWIKKVKDRWREQADLEGSDEARGDLVQILDTVIAMAFSNTVIVRDKDGNPVLDQAPTLPSGQPNPGYLKPLVKADPKVQHILHAVSQLRALKGADKPAHHKVTLDGDINAMPDVDALPEAVQATLKAELEKLAGGDLRKLAGEWFRDESQPEKKP